ncbi:YsnF/AvaK domain-containing protein [Dyadobacter sandarakinus]|uniref:YsnF/AvaK domain-containing protein n=1 Tax=Dyadobacter sandarakinus TaxID=2747268 RepID=A0ABX7I4R7_9BACT|nr:YsnF/AvaK domain-containing protein [Dyadobacter sandarakinus]QRR00213.1 YsnF/AvaK domain-containing protein [Dyadobacter sandarakinus]
MSNTVVGIFEYESDAQKAQAYLLANGFSDADVDVKTASYQADASETLTSNRDEDLGDRVGNFFKDLFDGDEDETRRYTEAGRRSTIVTVHAATVTEAQAAAAILDQYGAADVNEGDDTYSANQAYTTPVTDTSLVSDDATTSLPVIEEELLVGKREVETGGVRLRSRIVERPVQESIRLRQERVTINRTPVDRVASESDFDTFKEGTIEVREHAEVPVVSKEARVIQEVSLSKTVEEHDEVINDTVRHTEVDVEDLTDEEKLRRSGLDL